MAAAALMDPARHAGKSYRPTGPTLLGAEDMAQAIARAVGRSVKVLPTPTWLFMKSARLAGIPDRFDEQRSLLHRRSPAGAFEVGAPTADVLEVTGRPAEDFETIARRYAALPQNQRTVRESLAPARRAHGGATAPGFDFAAYDRELRRPFPSQPQFAHESAGWQREHIASVARAPRVARSFGSRLIPRGET